MTLEEAASLKPGRMSDDMSFLRTPDGRLMRNMGTVKAHKNEKGFKWPCDKCHMRCWCTIEWWRRIRTPVKDDTCGMYSPRLGAYPDMGHWERCTLPNGFEF